LVSELVLQQQHQRHQHQQLCILQDKEVLNIIPRQQRVEQRQLAHLLLLLPLQHPQETLQQ
jgi:hypothetical protein